MIGSYMSVGDSMPLRIQKQLDLAAADDRIKAVILRIDSPGGEVMASDKIAKAIRNFRRKMKYPSSPAWKASQPVEAITWRLPASSSWPTSSPSPAPSASSCSRSISTACWTRWACSRSL